MNKIPQKQATGNIIAGIGDARNAEMFLDDLLIDMENAGGLDWTVGGLIMLLGAVADKDEAQRRIYVERLQRFIYARIDTRPKKTLPAYLRSLRDSKDSGGDANIADNE
jgi:hypothetical protein